jgi:signal-transduction protein with cAMP-binding, CBS, and nucleotidyltransferase domain
MLVEGSHLAPEFVDYVRLDRQNVAELMTTAVISKDERTSVTELPLLMAQNRIKRVSIRRDGKLVGIVSRAT